MFPSTLQSLATPPLPEKHKLWTVSKYVFDCLLTIIGIQFCATYETKIVLACCMHVLFMEVRKDK